MKRPTLKSSVALVEDSIITISGPALAISGIIAGVDLVSGGSMLKDQAWLALVWAITLLLTLDFQVLCLGVRAHRAYSSQVPWQKKTVEILLAVIVAAAISYVSIQMQSVIARVNAENISIDAAAAQLGVNTVALIWERSTLVLVLIFMSGWLREHDDHATREAVNQPTAAAATIGSEDLQAILASLARIDALEQTLARVQITQEETPVLLSGPPEEPDEALANEKARADQQFASKKEAVEAVLAARPDASPEEVAQLAGCSVRTAAKWMLQQEADTLYEFEHAAQDYWREREPEESEG